MLRVSVCGTQEGAREALRGALALLSAFLRVHAAGRGGAERAGGVALRGLRRASIVDDVVLRGYGAGAGTGAGAARDSSPLGKPALVAASASGALLLPNLTIVLVYLTLRYWGIPSPLCSRSKIFAWAMSRATTMVPERLRRVRTGSWLSVLRMPSIGWFRSTLTTLKRRRGAEAKRRRAAVASERGERGETRGPRGGPRGGLRGDGAQGHAAFRTRRSRSLRFFVYVTRR